MNYTYSPEYQALLPPLSDEEMAELKKSIQTSGLFYRIVVNPDRVVLDGHNRLKICEELKIEPQFEIRNFKSKLEEKRFVIEVNLRRRHLNPFQRVELAYPLLDIEQKIAKQNMSKGGKGEPIDTPLGRVTDVVAKKANVSPKTFERAKKIIEEGTPEQKQQIRTGKSSINRIFEEINAPKREKHQKEIVERMVNEYAPAIERAFNGIKSQDTHDPERNKLVLSMILKNLDADIVFCPSCGHKMLECSHCHKTLKTLREEGKI